MLFLVTYYVVPRDQEARYFQRRKHVKVTLRIGKHTSEKEFTIPASKAKMVVKAFNILETTRNNITITASNIKRLTSNFVFKIKNLRIKK